MQYPVAGIVEAVRIALDQNQLENSIIAQEDNTLELVTIIRQKILHAARHLLETSGVSVLGQGKAAYIMPLDENGDADSSWDGFSGDDEPLVLREKYNLSWGELSAWELQVPGDYLRLLSLRMSDWKRAVHATIPFESAEYSQLQSGFIGITGNPERPVVAEAKTSFMAEGTIEGQSGVIRTLENERWFEIYTSATGRIVNFRYCPIPIYVMVESDLTDAPEVECLDFPEKLYRMLIYQTASLVAATYKDTALAQLLMNMVYEGEPQDKEEQ